MDAALACFWQRGYGASSVRDLGEAMGLSTASLYNAFGDKQALFGLCLERYLASFMRARIAACEQMPPLQAVSAFLDSVVVRSLEDPRGCLLVNTAVEVAPHDAQIGAMVRERLGELEAFFLRLIQRGQRDGSMAGQVAAADAARLLVGCVMGLRVLARARPEPALLHGIARQALAQLRPPSTAGRAAPRDRSSKEGNDA